MSELEATFEFGCPICGGQIQVDPSFYGQSANCPHCTENILVPDPSLHDRSFSVECVCPSCGNLFGLNTDWMGKRVECPFCDSGYKVPGTSTENFGYVCRFDRQVEITFPENCVGCFTEQETKPINLHYGASKLSHEDGATAKAMGMVLGPGIVTSIIGASIGAVVGEATGIGKDKWTITSILAQIQICRNCIGFLSPQNIVDLRSATPLIRTALISRQEKDDYMLLSFSCHEYSQAFRDRNSSSVLLVHPSNFQGPLHPKPTDDGLRPRTDCPRGHGILKAWNGQLRCWTCGWPEK